MYGKRILLESKSCGGSRTGVHEKKSPAEVNMQSTDSGLVKVEGISAVVICTICSRLDGGEL